MTNIINEWYSKEFRRKFESSKDNRATENPPPKKKNQFYNSQLAVLLNNK